MRQRSPARGPAVAPLHVGGGRGLVEEDHTLRVDVELPFEPGLARLHHVRTVLLGGVQIPFLRVMPWRRKKRDSPLRLAAAPLSPRHVPHLAQVDLRSRLVGLQDQRRMRLGPV